MKVRLIISFLILSIIAAMLPVSAASERAVFDVKTPDELPAAGDSFEVSVELSGNPGFCAIQFTLAYDESLMICEDAVTDGIVAGALSAVNPQGDGGAIIAAASLEIINGDGTVALFAFKAKEDIPEFKFKLKNIVFVDEENTDIVYEVAEGMETDENSATEQEKETEQLGGVSGTTYDEPSAGNIASGDETADIPPVTEPEADNESAEEPTEEVSFPDVVGHWAESYIGKAAKLGLFMGDTDGYFKPDDNVMRAQFVTVLWRMAGRPEADIELPFVDVDDQLPEFKSAIKWGYKSGHIKGTSDTTFEPYATLTREAGMRILHSYSGGTVGKEIQLYSIYDGTFKDSNKVSGWAKSSVYWGIYNKLISGVSADMLSPQGTATRAQLATILVNYLDVK